MNCPVCNQILPDKAKFCYKCKSQIVCTECGETLLEGADMCVYCGTSITKETASQSANKFELKEDKNSRSVSAVFSDNTADSLVNALTHLFSVNKFGVSLSPARQIEDVNVDEERKMLEPQASTNPIIPPPVLENNPELDLLNEIFQYRGEELYLHETELKALTKTNFTERLTLLYIFYKQLNGAETVQRKELNTFLDKYQLNDVNFRKWLSKSKRIINNHNNLLSLCRAGIDKAKEYLTDVFDDNKIGKWSTGNTKKNKSNSTTSSTVAVKSKSKSKTYTNLGNLDLNPKEKESLVDFISKYSKMSGLKYNAVFVYYLEKIILEKNITADHIYTCYKKVKISPPSNLYQSIMDTGARYAWINTSDINNLKMTLSGENAVENHFENK